MTNNIIPTRTVNMINEELWSEELKDTFSECFYNWREDKYIFDEKVGGTFLWNLLNWDFIVVYPGKDRASVTNSNHTYLAKWVNKMYSRELVKRIADNFHGYLHSISVGEITLTD